MSQAPTADGGVASIPRRWSDTLDGIRWLPRLIDKARMSNAGALGAYLLGHSPFDAALLERLNITTDDFASLVAASSGDADVLARLRERGFDEPRVRRWSDRLPRSARWFIPYWDLDDGYVQGGRAWTLLISLWRWIEHPAMNAVRAISRKP